LQLFILLSERTITEADDAYHMLSRLKTFNNSSHALSWLETKATIQHLRNQMRTSNLFLCMLTSWHTIYFTMH